MEEQGKIWHLEDLKSPVPSSSVIAGICLCADTLNKHEAVLFDENSEKLEEGKIKANSLGGCPSCKVSGQ